MLCPNCGEEIRDTAKVCGHCGTRLASPAAAVPDLASKVVAPVDDGEPPEPTVGAAGSPLARLLWVLAIAVVATMVVVAALVFSGGDGGQDDASVTTRGPTTTQTAVTTTEPPPAALPIASLPDVIGGLLREVEVVEYDDLSVLPDVVLIDAPEGGVRLGDGIAIEGGASFGADAGGPDGYVTEGVGMVFRFSYEEGTSLSFVLENSAGFANPEYRRFGFRMGADWRPDSVLIEHYDKGVEITGFEPIGDLVLVPGVDYVALLGRDGGGSFVLAVWQEASPVTFAVDVRDFGDEWQGPFGFYVSVESGTIHLHEFWLVGFSGVR